MIQFCNEENITQYIYFKNGYNLHGELIELYKYKNIFELEYSWYLSPYAQRIEEKLIYEYEGCADVKLTFGNEECYITLVIDFQYQNIQNIQFHFSTYGRYIEILAILKSISELLICKRNYNLPEEIRRRLDQIDEPLRAIMNHYESEGDVIIPGDAILKIVWNNQNLVLKYPIDGKFVLRNTGDEEVVGYF